MGTAMPSAVAQSLGIGYSLPEYQPLPELALLRPRSQTLERSHSQPARRQLPAIKITKRPPPPSQQAPSNDAPFSPLATMPYGRPQSPGSPPPPVIDDNHQDGLALLADTAREASDHDNTCNDTPFMRLFKAHGGRCLVHTLTGPLAASNNPIDSCKQANMTSNKAAADWRATCARARAITPTESQRAYIDELGSKHAPPPDLQQTAARCYAPRASNATFVHGPHMRVQQQYTAATEPVPKQTQPGPTISRRNSGQLAPCALMARSQAHYMQVPNLDHSWLGPARPGALDNAPSSARVTSVFERLQTTMRSPQKQGRAADFDSSSVSSPISDAIGPAWDSVASQTCSLCGEQPCEFRSNCCG